jgi:hypothetical protein
MLPMNLIASTMNRPFAQLLVDLITNLPMNDGWDSILIIIDHGLSKGAIVTPCTKTITAEKTTMIFIKKVFVQYGMYDKIISD